jgi:hypothetical protein
VKRASERTGWPREIASLCTFSDAGRGARGWPYHPGVRKPVISLVEKELLKQTARGHFVFASALAGDERSDLL